MPNWIDNVLMVTSTNEKELEKFKKQAVSDKKLISLSSFVPIPDDLNQSDSKKWREWSYQNWTVGREIPVESIKLHQQENKLVYRFCTAWSTPINWFDKLVLMFPELDFSLTYYGTDDRHAGKVEFIDGEKVVDRECSYDNDADEYVEIVTEGMSDEEIENHAKDNIKFGSLDYWEYDFDELVSYMGEEHRKYILQKITEKILLGDLEEGSEKQYVGRDISDIIEKVMSKEQFYENFFEYHKKNGSLKHLVV